MAVIVLDIATIPGESRVASFQNKLDAVSIGDTIEIPVPKGGGTSGRRTSGGSHHTSVELVRYKDIGSPLLAKACAGGTNLGEVKIYIFRTLETGLKPYMQYTLQEAFVSRLEHETEDDMGTVYGPHISEGENLVSPSSRHGAAPMRPSAAAAASRPSVRSVSVRPAMSGSSFFARNSECERLWLNASSVRWTYTEYQNGVKLGDSSQGWNIQQGITL